MPYCSLCNITVDRKRWTGHVRSNTHKNNSTVPICDNVELIKSAFKGRIASYKVVASNEEVRNSPSLFLNNIKNQIKSLINHSLQTHTCIKVNFEFFCTFLLIKNEPCEETMKSFCTKNFTLHFNYDFNALYTNVECQLLKKVEDFEERDSGWTFLSTSHIEVNINKYQPLSGSRFINLPKSIQSKKACLNIKNKDEYCFLWCVTAALYPTTKHPERVTSYPHFRDVLNVKGISFPVTLSDVAIFERNNPNLNINIYGLNDKKSVIGPLYKSEVKSERSKHINLLLLENDTSSHYCLIKDLPRLVRSQITKHHGKIYLCESCLLFFPSSDQLDNHLCGGVVTVLPDKGSVIQFKNYERKQNVPFTIYADFETMLEPIQHSHSEQNKSNTTILQRHVPVAFAYNIVSTVDDSYNRFVTHRGKNCVAKFINLLHKDVVDIYKILSQNKPMVLTKKDETEFEKASRCHICEDLLWGDKVRDHCHITGRYRGAAHRHCNLQYKQPKFIPIFFHNLSGYDCHLFIKELGETPGKINILPKTKEKYISFSKFIPVSEDAYVQLRFLDSYHFLGTSLDKLAKTMEQDDFISLRSHFPDDTKFHLLTRKGVYPYDYMTDWECYEETLLPRKNNFFNSMTNESISDSDYEHAKTIWTEFNIQNLGDYTDLYLKTDVLLLTDIFESFRKTCKKHYKLDPAFYVTAPSLSFDAMLLETGVQLELISDLAIIRMIQDGIRGGVCMCSHRYAKANHKYMTDYNKSQPDSFIVYLDCNNLYGYSMCQSLPFSNFRFLDEHEVSLLDIQSIDDDAEWGFILEVDLLYPESLHRQHNDLPFCPEKFIPPGGKTVKLIPNLYNKYKYVIHYVHLKKCMEHGLILRKIHRVITFRQSPYLKRYIELNTKLRQKAKSAFEQDFFKLLNNSVFGKTLENTEKRVNVQLVNQWEDFNNTTKKSSQAARLIANPYFHSSSVFSENLVAIQLKPNQLVLDKPIYIGFAVLELSKSHMYNFHYNIVKPFYKEKIKLCYTDTDSLIYTVNTNDFYLDLKKRFLSYFDSSNYDPNNMYNIPQQNKKIPGLFKDEMGGKIITDFVGLRSKLYCIKSQDKVTKKAKGVKACVVRDLKISDYEDVLLYKKNIRKRNVLFKSIKHQIFTQSVNKVALSANDDKRLVSFNNIETKAWGPL